MPLFYDILIIYDNNPHKQDDERRHIIKKGAGWGGKVLRAEVDGEAKRVSPSTAPGDSVCIIAYHPWLLDKFMVISERREIGKLELGAWYGEFGTSFF